MATLGIFLPSFLFVALLNPLVPKMRKSQWLSKFLDAVNISAVGVMAGVTVSLMMTTVTSWQTGLIAIVSILAVIFIKKISALWIVVGGSGLGYIFSYI